MRRLVVSLVVLVTSLACAACGGGGGGGEPGEPLPGIYVDAAAGDDATGTGAFDAPFRTISRACLGAGIGEVVRVRPGMYDAALGERFPLRLAIGVTIIGNTFDHGRATYVIGSGTWTDPFDPTVEVEATIVPAGDSRIVGLRIRNPYANGAGLLPTAVLVHQSNVRLETCTLYGSGVGVRLTGLASGTTIDDCHIVGNGSGVFEDDRAEGDNNLLLGSFVKSNDIGINVWSYGLELGLDLITVGDNTIVQNSTADICLFTAQDRFLNAIGCTWDHVPLTQHVGYDAPPPGTDVWILNENDSQVGAVLGQTYTPAPTDPADPGGIGP
jgi:hypothetical protein